MIGAGIGGAQSALNEFNKPNVTGFFGTVLISPKLSLADRQMVEICKALIRDAQIIAFDEPTSSLSHHETEILFRLMRDLRQRGKILIYVSHRFDEIFELCDACTVLRDGHTTSRLTEPLPASAEPNSSKKWSDVRFRTFTTTGHERLDLRASKQSI